MICTIPLEQELAGVSLHLNAAADWSANLPSRVYHALTRARALEELVRAGGPAEAITPLMALDEARVRLDVSGTPRRLDRQVDYHLLRITYGACPTEMLTSRLRECRRREPLTDYACEILRFVVAGNLNNNIADALGKRTVSGKSS